MALPLRIARAGDDDPFPLRNQLPFNLLFLDQTPRGARVLEARRTRVAVHAAYESTFVASADLIALYRQDDFATLDGRVTLPILEGVAAGTPGRTGFVLDGETLRTTVDFGIGLGRRFEIDLEVPFLLHTSGVLDRGIDRYHARLGLPDGGRSAFARDRYVAAYVGDGAEVFFDGPAGGFHPGDVVLTGRAALLRQAARRPDLAASLAVKLPTGDPRRLDGSGRADYGASIQISRVFGRTTLHAGYQVTRVGQWALAPSLPLGDPRSLFGACGVALTRRSTLIVQILRSSGPFHYRPGNDLGRVAQEIAAGFRTRTPRGHLFQWALIENLDQHLNTPDVGFFVGLSSAGTVAAGLLPLPPLPIAPPAPPAASP